MIYSKSTTEEKLENQFQINKLRRSLVDIKDSFACHNEDLFYCADRRLDQLEKEILNFNCKMWKNSKN